jgi:hypothetical protein
MKTSHKPHDITRFSLLRIKDDKPFCDSTQFSLLIDNF